MFSLTEKSTVVYLYWNSECICTTPNSRSYRHLSSYVFLLGLGRATMGWISLIFCLKLVLEDNPTGFSCSYDQDKNATFRLSLLLLARIQYYLTNGVGVANYPPPPGIHRSFRVALHGYVSV